MFGALMDRWNGGLIDGQINRRIDKQIRLLLEENTCLGKRNIRLQCLKGQSAYEAFVMFCEQLKRSGPLLIIHFVCQQCLYG